MDTARSIVHSVTHYIKNTDLYLMLLGLVCSIYGMLLIYSATLNPVTALDGSTKNLYVQGAAIILGLAAFVALSLIDLENLGDLWKIFVIGNILLQFLLFTPLGTEVNGQRAWLNLGVTSLQPGELGKLIFIFTIAAHMTEIQDHITEWRGLVSVGLHTLVMMGAVVLSSGDTGMAIQYLMIAELGFLGCLLIIILLMALIIRLFYVAYRASTPFSALIAVGVGGMLLFQTFMNIFMNVGLLPVMGLTLPFFSYGGTSIVTMFAALGIAAGVRMREKPSWLQN